MEFDIPEVVSEVSLVFQRYETALLGNDVDTLNELFWDDPRAVRFGVGENLYGHREIAEFRRNRKTGPFERTLRETRITTFGRDFAIACTEYKRAGHERSGRESKTLLRTAHGWRIVAGHVSLLGDTV